MPGLSPPLLFVMALMEEEARGESSKTRQTNDHLHDGSRPTQLGP